MEGRLREKVHKGAPKEHPSWSLWGAQALVHKLESLWKGCGGVAPESSWLSVNLMKKNWMQA